jgi:hypothetical protein
VNVHVCVWSDDRWPDLVCACGARAVMVLNDDREPTLVPLEVERSPMVPHQRMRVSA